MGIEQRVQRELEVAVVMVLVNYQDREKLNLKEVNQNIRQYNSDC